MNNRWNAKGLKIRKITKKLDNTPNTIFWMKCPGCAKTFPMYNNSCIELNIESKGRVKFDADFYNTEGCDNPMCKWSKINEESKKSL